MRRAGSCGSNETLSRDERDIQRRRRLACFTARNRIDTRFVGFSRPANGLGNVQARAGPSPKRLVPKPDIGDLRLANARQQLARLLIRIESFVRKFEVDRNRRLLSQHEGDGDDDHLNPRNPHAEGAAFANTLQAQ